MPGATLHLTLARGIRRALPLATAVLLAAVLPAHASRAPTDAERQAIANSVGIAPQCLDIAISTVDESFAVERPASGAGCSPGNSFVLMRTTGDGRYQPVLFGFGRERCPLAGVETAVAVDLKVCAAPAPKVYVPVSGKFRERPSRLGLSKKRTITNLAWSKWGGTTAQARGRHRKRGSRRPVRVTIRLSGRTTCSDGRRIYTRIRITAPRSARLPFARGGRWAKCAPAKSVLTSAGGLSPRPVDPARPYALESSPGYAALVSDLTHLDEHGAARMVDVADKPVTERRAVARALVRMSPATAAAVAAGDAPKGDVLGVARIAGIQAAKRTGELIPLCHPVGLDHVDVEGRIDVEAGAVELTASARVSARTGVEMEAMTAAAVAALTVYDMVKGLDRGISIENVELLEKSGGRSGAWMRARAVVPGYRAAPCVRRCSPSPRRSPAVTARTTPGRDWRICSARRGSRRRSRCCPTTVRRSRRACVRWSPRTCASSSPPAAPA